MNLASFLAHWQIVENPFRGEEARQDPVFLRLEAAHAAGVVTPEVPPGQVAMAGPGVGAMTAHSEFEKLAGEFDNPSTAIVFGEKGSGKTAIRLQLADRVAAYNKSHPNARCLWVAYDDLNPILGRFVERMGSKPSVTETLGKFRLVDHIDAMLSLIVPVMVDRLLKVSPEPSLTTTLELPEDARKIVRKFSAGLKQDLLLLQTVYDAPGSPAGGEERTKRLRRVLRVALPTSYMVWTLLASVGWLLPAWLIYTTWRQNRLTIDTTFTHIDKLVWLIAGAIALYLLILLKRSVWDRVRYIAAGHRVRRQVRVSVRSDASFARSIRQIEPSNVDPAVLPMTSADEPRYAMLDRLQRVLRAFGYRSIMVVIDRVDEPTLVSGDPDRMRAVIWPMLNNKFLQLPGVGVKMLLPMELRHALFRESAAFFQEARLDKQNLIERLSWTGATLYDLCNARLQACRAPGSASISLLDLFAEDVTRQDLLDSLEQMHQPRDAFKMLYQCFTEHCANVTAEQSQWRIPRIVLEVVRKAQVERVRQLYRGVRPA